MYKVVRIAVDPLGAPISGQVQTIAPRRKGHQERLWEDVEIGPFDTVDDVWTACKARLDIQQRLDV